jgi:carboxymethylenebutenolidase
MSNAVQIRTVDGVADSHIFHPQGTGPCPAVILYMDGIGIRPELLAMGQRLADNGYVALVPNLFYRAGPAQPTDVLKMLSPGPENDRMMSLVMGLSGEQVMRDTRAWLEFLDKDPKIKGPKVGTVGYCMGGSMSLRAASTYPDRVVAAAAIHAARLATDQADSPHLLASQMKARIYVGVAGIDPWLVEGETQTLKMAFDAAGVNYLMEDYPGATHGFAMCGLPIYDRKASEKHWERLLAMFGDTLS